jgi:hypothetical protein
LRLNKCSIGGLDYVVSGVIRPFSGQRIDESIPDYKAQCKQEIRKAGASAV